MTGQAYDVGALVRISGVFTDEDGVAQDPAAVFCAFETPAGIETIRQYTVAPLDIIRDSTGNYHLDVDANAPGVWDYRWYSTGAGQAADEEHFSVNDTDF